MTIKRPLAAVLVLLLGLLPVMARAQATDPGLRDTAQLVVSERLRTFALARALAIGGPDIGTALDLKQLLKQQGFYIDKPGWQRIAAAQALYPEVTYVPNMNGGAPQDRLDLYGLSFYLRDNLLAQGAMALGGGYDGLVRYGLSNGHYLELRGQVNGLYAPAPDLSETQGQIAICSRNHIAGWRFLDLCLSHFEDHRALQDITREEATLTFSDLFELGQTRHEVDLGLTRRRLNDTYRSEVNLGLDSVWRRSATRLSLDIGAPQLNETGVDLDASAEIRWRLAGHLVGVGVQAAQSPSTYFLGEVRQDRGLGVSGIYGLNKDVTLSVGYYRNNSTVDFFDDRQLSFTVSYSLH